MNRPPPTVAALLADAASRHGENVALVDGQRRTSWRDLRRRVRTLAVAIRERAAPGDRVVVAMANSDGAVISLLAAMTSGTTAVPLHPDWPETRVAAILDDCAPAVALVDDSTAGAAVSRLCPHAMRASPPSREHEPRQEEPIDPKHIAILFYTSGTTRGAPRGVVCPHRQVTFCVGAIDAVLGYRSSDVILCALPLSFDYGMYQVLLAMRAGASVVLQRDAGLLATLPTTLQAESVTIFPLVPSMAAGLLHSRLLLRTELPALRMITSTGDTFPAPHISALRRILPHVQIVPMYGLTECKRVSIMLHDSFPGHEQSVGKPLPGTTVRIVGEDEREAAPNEAGELRIRGPHLTDGYWRDAAATADRFLVAEDGGRELRSGDIFRRDEDGFLYFVSRSEYLIKSHGQRVGTREVEEVIAAHPAVAEAAVVGMPSLLGGEAIVAFVVARAIGVTEDELRLYCRSQLYPAARPARFIIDHSLLPRTANGKIDRLSLRARAAALEAFH